MTHNHRPPRARRRRRRRGVPALIVGTSSGVTVAAVDLGASSGASCRPGRRRRRRGRRAGGGAPLRQRPGAGCPTACTGTCWGCSPRCSSACGSPRPRARLGGHRLQGGRLRPAARRAAARRAVHLPRLPDGARCGRGPRPGGREELLRPQRPAAPRLQHLFQLATEGPLLEVADTALLVPDLLGHWLGGVRVAERTNASTTGLLGLADGEWDNALCTRLGLPAGVLPPLVDRARGSVPCWATSGPRRASRTRSTWSPSAPTTPPPRWAGTPFGGGAGVPLAGDVGPGRRRDHRPAPLEAARAANLDPRAGRPTAPSGCCATSWAPGSSRGLLDSWRRAGRESTSPTCSARRPPCPSGSPPTCRPSTSTTRRSPPPRHAGAVAAWLTARGERVADERARPCGLVCGGSPRRTPGCWGTWRGLTGRDVPVVHVVGGGARNALVCDLLAARAGVPVVAGARRGDRDRQRAGPGAGARRLRARRRPGDDAGRRPRDGAAAHPPPARPVGRALPGAMTRPAGRGGRLDATTSTCCACTPTGAPPRRSRGACTCPSARCGGLRSICDVLDVGRSSRPSCSPPATT